jgi:predicted amidohydrolase
MIHGALTIDNIFKKKKSISNLVEKKLTVGYIQFRPQFGQPDKNISYIWKQIDKVKEADLIVLPELCTTGYAFHNREEAKTYAEPVPQGKTIQMLQSMSKKRKMHIVAGINEKQEDNLYNSAVFLTPEGYVGKYRKNHLFNKEKIIFDQGNLKFPIFYIDDIKIGILICFDWIFPEAWRTLVLKGADIICHPSNLVLKNLAHRSIPVTAMTNRIYIISSNRIGIERNLTFIGESMIVDPEGNIVHRAPSDKEESFMTTINPYKARDKMITERNDVLGDRRPDIYEL